MLQLRVVRRSERHRTCGHTLSAVDSRIISVAMICLDREIGHAMSIIVRNSSVHNSSDWIVGLDGKFGHTMSMIARNSSVRNIFVFARFLNVRAPLPFIRAQLSIPNSDHADR